MIPADWMPKAKMEQIVCHWTGGTYRANATDKKSYHILIQGDGTLVRGDHPISANVPPIKAGKYAAHCLNNNSRTIGVSLCCMGGKEVRESPFNAGRYPMTKEQWTVLAKVVAELANFYRIPVTPKTILSHAEVQPNLGIRQKNKWDFTRLAFAPDVVGYKACGDMLRRDVLAAQGTPAAGVAHEADPMPMVDLPMNVRELQTRLNYHGARLLVDGALGPKTKRAVLAFQKEHGLSVDGIVGPMTRAALRSD